MAIAVIGYLVLPHLGQSESVFVGQAQLIRDDSIPSGVWQVNADVRNSPELKALLETFVTNPGDDLEGPIWSIVDGAASSRELPQPLRPDSEDLLFPGGPRLVVEWSKGAQLLQAILYQRQSKLLAGRIRGVVPSSGLIARPPGDKLDILREVPADLERLAWISVSSLQLPPLYKSALEDAWKRWEFFPLQEFGPMLGPGLALMEWKGRRHVIVQLKDAEAAQKAIERRFSSAVVKMHSGLSYGVRVSGFNPSGPAWFVRGDSVTAVSEGGTSCLSDLLAHRLDPEKKRPEPLYPELTEELERLAGSQPGWHLCLADFSSKAPFPWAALVRWPVQKSTQIEGYLVVDLSGFAK